MQYIKIINPGIVTWWQHKKVGEIFKVDEGVHFPNKYAIELENSLYGIVDHADAVDVTAGMKRNIWLVIIIIVTVILLSLITILLNG